MSGKAWFPAFSFLVSALFVLLVTKMAEPSGVEGCPIWWSEELGLSKLSAIPARLTEPFTPQYQRGLVEEYANDNSPVPHNCEELLKSASRLTTHPDLDWDGHTDDRGQLTGRCAVIQLLQHAKPARFCHLSRLPWNTKTFAMLPAGVAWVNNNGDLFESTEAEKRGQSIVQSNRKSTFRLEDSYIHEDNSEDVPYGANYNILAKADFLGDGSEDWAVQAAGGPAAQGHITFHIFMVTRRSMKEGIRFVKRIF